ncbi:hypothetical protein TRAPUB_11895 [Trametes pubescens]|uniref:Uncharacterized protein n=1 Tax=Trametes pubescens TaxID=154538 RepID=A0A1M2VVN0_TRAPU|nr:hypothetical protein TRAPUB_11895 [Trametes pubescens]
MPRYTVTPTFDKRDAHSMSRPMPCEHTQNTATMRQQEEAGPSAPTHTTTPAPPSKAVEDWRRNVAKQTGLAQRISSTTAAPAVPHRGLAPPPRLTYQTDERVMVYMPDGNGGLWRPGKIADLKNFRPKITVTGSFSYPVVLDQWFPRIMQWFDEGQDHIYPLD